MEHCKEKPVILYADALMDASENRQTAPKVEKNTTQEGGAKYSIRETTDGRFVAVVESDILKDIDTSSWNQEKKRKAQAAASEALKQFSDGIVVNGVTRVVNRTSRREYTRSKDTARLYRSNTELFADKMRAADVADDIVVAATNWNRDGGLNHPRTDDFVDFDHGRTLIMSGSAKYNAEVVVGITSGGTAVFYDVVDMSPTEFEIKNAEPHSTATTNESIGDMIGGSAGSNVAQKTTEVNKKFSSRDSNGNTLTTEQQEYFKDSKVRDEQGRLLVMYHGTPSGKHTTFRSGTYFTPDRQYADVYQSPGASALSVKREKGAPKTYEVYLNITKPFDTRNDTEREIFMQEYYRQWGTGAPLSDSGLPDWTDGMDLQEFIEEMGYDYDGLILDEGATGVYGMEVKSRGLSYVTFSSNQVTAFIAEPTTSINMIADALLKGKRGNRKYYRGAIGAVLASQILNSILVSFVYAGRDDDEDETYVEKYLGTLTGELLDSLNPATYIPFIKDIVSIVQGYDVERSDMAVVSDLWNAWQKLGSDKLSPYRKVEGFVGSIAQIFGLPVKNVMRDARGIYQTIASFMSGQKTTNAGIGYAVQSAVTGQTVSNQQQLYEAYLSGDKTQISRVEGRFKNQSAINTAIRAALRENDSRIRVAAEARVNGNLTEYTRLAKEIISEGHFSQDNVIAAINAEINAMSKSDSTSTPKALGLYKAEDFATAISGGDSAMASAVRDDIIQTAQKNGKTADEAEKSFISSAKSSMKELFLAKGITETQAVNALVAYCGETGEEARKRVAEWAFEEEYGFTYGEKIQKFKDGTISAAELKGVLIDVDGKTADEAASAIVSYSREGYEEGSFSRSETAELMMEYGGLTRTEAEAKLRYIDFKIANPDVYADDAWIDEYYEEVQSSGISINVFVEYRNTVKSMTGTNKKVQRMAVIDSLPISNDQKDTLYYAEGWAASRLYEAPWH